MKYVSVCSGVEAASIAFNELGFTPVAFAEIDETCNAFLAHKYPGVPNVGDFSKHDWTGTTADILIGGCPCQTFSIRGQGDADNDPRGVLSYEFIELARKLNAKYFIYENVPDVLTADKGRFFPRWLQKASECGYHVAWRLLDTYQFGLPLRRERLFAVGHFGSPTGLERILDFEGRRSRGNLSDREKEFDRLNSDEGIREGVSISVWHGSQNPVGRTETIQPLLKGHVKRHGVLDRRDRASGDVVRLITALEMERSFGFPDNYTRAPGISETQRQAFLGNSFCPQIIKFLGEGIVQESV